MIFVITWNSKDRIENNYLLLIGIAYLFVGGLDLVHTLAYGGMGIFTGYGSNLPTQLWISARYIEASSLLVAPLLLSGDRIDVSYPMLGYSVVFSLVLFSVFGGFFPVCYVEGVGLTVFKKVSEYVISIILAFSFYFLYRYRDRFKKEVFHLLGISIFLTIGSELAFTFYVDVYGFSNLVGHFFKLSSFYLVYRALVVTGFREPFDLLYRELKTKEKELEKSKERAERERDKVQTYLDLVGSIIVALDKEGKVTLINRKGCEILESSESEIVGKNWFENFVPEEEREDLKEVHEKTMSGEIDETGRYENRIVTSEGLEKTISWQNTPLLNDEGEITGTLSSGIDVTERKRAEEREDFLHSLLRHDVRNKLQVIRGYLELVEDLDLSEEAEEYISLSMDDLKEGVEIIEKVRTLREAQEEKVREIEVSSAIYDAVDEVEGFAEERGIEIGVDCPEEGCEVLAGSLLDRVFLNIFENAVQHSGGSKIRVRGMVSDDEVKCIIEDDGQGIPGEKKDMIFDKGYTTDEDRGTGLGMFLVKTLLETYDGSVDVKDSELGGARFDVKLKKA